MAFTAQALSSRGVPRARTRQHLSVECLFTLGARAVHRRHKVVGTQAAKMADEDPQSVFVQAFVHRSNSRIRA